MMEMDQSITWRGLEERLDRTTNSRHRKMLETVIAHAKAETEGDVEGLMATLGNDPQYHFWSSGKDWGPKGLLQVRKFYEDFVTSAAGFFESDKVRVVVDDENLVTESVMKGIVPGVIAQQRGCNVPDVNRHYIVHARTAIFWPFDEDCVLLGEDSYGSSDVTDFEQVPNDELPTEYVRMLDAVGFTAAR